MGRTLPAPAVHVQLACSPHVCVLSLRVALVSSHSPKTCGLGEPASENDSYFVCACSL